MEKSKDSKDSAQAHFVTFLSPGTFVAESTTKEVQSWNVEEAKKIAEGIVERYGATPYGFYFTTRKRGPQELDSKEVARSGTYYLKGRILTVEDVKNLKDPKCPCLLDNMKANKWDRVVENLNGYRWFQPLDKYDVVLELVK